MQDYLSQFIANFIRGIPNLLTALAIFIVSLYLARIISNILRRVLKRQKAPEGVTQILGQLILWTVIALGAITAMQRFFDVTAFLAGLGIIGFTIGFALQDVMKNLAAGILLLVQQPFHVGEVIGVAGFDGTVQQIDLRSTEMETTDGRIVTLPNANILSNPIINYTRARTAAHRPKPQPASHHRAEHHPTTCTGCSSRCCWIRQRAGTCDRLQ